MPTYRVRLQGRNFWLRMQGEVRHLGFYTNRFVEAPDPRSAEAQAFDLLRADPKLQAMENNPSDRPSMSIDETCEVDRSEVPDVVQGYVFFPEETGGDA